MPTTATPACVPARDTNEHDNERFRQDRLSMRASSLLASRLSRYVDLFTQAKVEAGPEPLTCSAGITSATDRATIECAACATGYRIRLVRPYLPVHEYHYCPARRSTSVWIADDLVYFHREAAHPVDSEIVCRIASGRVGALLANRAIFTQILQVVDAAIGSDAEMIAPMRARFLPVVLFESAVSHFSAAWSRDNGAGALLISPGTETPDIVPLAFAARALTTGRP